MSDIYIGMVRDILDLLYLFCIKYHIKMFNANNN